MLGQGNLRLVEQPAPYHWNAVLAYAAGLGWGLQQHLTAAQYSEGKDLFRYTQALTNVGFQRGGPIEMPIWLSPPSVD